MDLKTKIKEMLGNNIPPNAVAAATGVDPSYISQLMSAELFASEVQNLRVERLSEATNRDAKLGKLEDELLSKIEEAIPLMFKPGDLLGAFKILNSAQRRGAAFAGEQEQIKPTVPLNLPQVVIQNFVLNGQRQVVEVGGRSMITANSGALLDQVRARVDNKMDLGMTGLTNMLERGKQNGQAELVERDVR